MKKITLFLVAIFAMNLFSFAQSQMSGTYTVGTGGTYDYASLADAGMAIKSAEFTGDVTLLICTDLTETINTGIVNKSNYTLTIRPDKDENRTITYTTAKDNTGPTGVFVIGGDMTKTPGSTIGWASIPTRNVIVDGAAAGYTTPRLKITNEVFGTNVLLYGDVQDVTIKNCTLVGRSSGTAYSLAFRSENYSQTSKNIGPKNCVAENCIIESASSSSQVIYCQGNQANSYAGYPTNITIRNCSIKAHTRGIFLYGVNGLNVEGCTFDMSNTPSQICAHGILGTTTKGTINVKGNKFIKNTTKNNYVGEYGLQTITASGGADVWNIENNYFADYDALASGTTSKESRLVGVRCGDYCVVRHNTFYIPKLTYAPGTSLVGTHAVALLWLAGSHKYPVQNNIFVCEETTTNVSLIRGSLNENVAGNVFYHNGGNAAIVAGAPSCMTFADLKTSYPTQAATSKWTNVIFTDATNGNLSLAGTSDGDINLEVNRLAEVLTDIEGKTRREKTCVGAYEGRKPLPSSINLKVYPVQDYSTSIVGTLKRAIQNDGNTIVLTHEADGTPHIYNIAHATKTITELSQEGVVARDPENAGDYLSISDIALTEDGKLIASNYMRCEQGTTPATGYKVGEIRYYIWDNINAAPTRWFTTNRTANSTYADVSYTFAIKGTSTNAQLMSTAVHNNNRAARINLHTVVNGEETAYHRFGLHTTASEYTETKQGLNFQLTATPLDNIWTLEGELTDATSFAVPATVGSEYNGTALAGVNLGKKYNGVNYLPNYNDHHLMVAPYADGEGKLAGVKVLGITHGFSTATAVETNTALETAINAVAAAATAYVDRDGDLTIYLFADSKVYTFSEKDPTLNIYTVTATAGVGGSVEGGGTYGAGSTATLVATPADHYTFKNWTVAGSEVSTNATYSFVVTRDVEVTANFTEDPKYSITATADNSMGSVTGSGTYYKEQTVTLKAIAKTGYYFTSWSDSNTDNPRTFTATEDLTLTANFAEAHARVYAYDLNVTNNGDSYTFSFKPNTNAVTGNLLLYSEDGASVVQTLPISKAIVAHTVTTITLNKAELPDQSEVPWAIELSGNAIPAFAETFADADYRFARAHAVVDNSPESEYFGRVYVADRRSTKSNSSVYVYNPDFTDLANTKLGLATAGYSRPAVGADGTLYLTGYTDGAEAGIFVVNPADLTKCTQFFNGTYDADGLYTNNSVEIGSSTSGVGVYGAGKDAVLYTMMEDGSNANFNSGKQPIVCYKIGQNDGTVLKQWSEAPTWLVNYPAKAADKSYNYGNNDFAATAKGVWVSQNKSNVDDRPEIAFIDNTGTIQLMQNSKKCFGGGMTVNADNTALYIVEDSKILEYSIAWNENTPSLTLSNTYPISLSYISTLSVDYAGNLIACAGTSYATTNNNVMKVVSFTLPTNDNTCTVPAAKNKTLKLGARYNVEVAVNANEMGRATGGGEYKEGATATFIATPNYGYRFLNWTYNSETSTDNPLELTIESDLNITANFEPIQYTIIALTNDENKGTVTGAGTYNYGSEVTLTAEAKPGYKLLYWSDRSTDNPRTITMKKNEAISAYFVKDYDEEPTFTIEKLWENTNVPASTNNGFQAVGWDGKIYMKDRLGAAINVYTANSSELYMNTDAFTSEDALKGDQPIAIDDAGNIIIRSGSGLFYSAPTQVTILRKGETTGKTIDFTLPATGRCDFISASGDIYSTKGGYVYFYCMGQTKVNRVKIAEGALVSIEEIGSGLATGQSQSHVMTNIFGNIIAHTKSNNIKEIDVHTNQTVALTLPTHKLNTLGGCSFELGGKELIAYNITGTNYNSEWKLYNMTDKKFLSNETLYVKDKASTNSAANWLNVQVVDENTAYIYQFCPTVAVAVWKVSLVRNDLQEFTVTTTANNANLGSIIGAGTYYDGATAMLTATPAASCRFVNWTKAGVEVSTDDTYLFTVTGDVELVANFELMLLDTKNNEAVLTSLADQTADVAVYRSLTSGMYNTLCLPFDVATLTGTPLENTTVWQYNGATVQGSGDYKEIFLDFTEVDAIVAGQPYLVEPNADIEAPMEFRGVKISAIEGYAVGSFEAVTMQGVLHPTELQANDKSILFLVANNELAWANVTANMNGMRAYFKVNEPSLQSARTRAYIKRTPTVATGMENTEYNPQENNTRKIIYNNTIYILRGDEVYTIQGTKVK